MKLNMGIVHACVPTFRPLCTCIFHHARNAGQNKARANSEAMLIEAKGKVKSGAKDTAGEKGVLVNEHDLEKDVKGTNGEISANRTLMYRDLIMARGLESGCSGFE